MKTKELYYTVKQMKALSAKKSTMFHESHTKDDKSVDSWMNHLIIVKTDGRINIYRFLPKTGRFRPTEFSKRAETIAEARELIEKEGKGK